MNRNKLKVCISFDVEFNINQAFNKVDNKPLGREVFELNSGEGFDNIVSILERNSAKATFFVEALNTCYFSNDEMGRYARSLLSKGFDVQMHTHPCWEFFAKENWQSYIPVTPKDNYSELSVESIVESLNLALDVFSHWQVPRPTAFRAGNLAASGNLYKALKICGFEHSSNIGMPYFKPKEEHLQFENDCREIDGVYESPVTSFVSMGWKKKLLTITGTSFYEMKNVLQKAHEQGVENIVVLTHIHEFLNYDKNQLNKINLARLNKLCRLINKNEEYEFANISELNIMEKCRDRKIKTSPLSGLITQLENVINDKL